MAITAFKTCSCCCVDWQTRHDFIADPAVQIVGYQVNFDDLELGFFLFDHLLCHSTMAIQAGLFTDLYHGPVFTEALTGSDECPGHCLIADRLGRCPQSCACAYIREVLEMLRHPADIVIT